jgi:hypothetical protein
MPNYITASRTKDHFQEQLLREHPEIVSIAPQLKLDDNGHATEEAVIVVGVSRQAVLRYGSGSFVSPSAQPIPPTLPAVDERGASIAGEEIPVIVEETGEIVAHMNTARMRPCPGGFSVGHTLITMGTFGGNARFGANFGFILSNNHVLANVNAAAVGDAILQPGPADGGTAPADTIARLTRWVPIDLNGGNNEVDCAIAQEVNAGDLLRNVQGIGTPAAMANATVGQAVRKSGRTTQLTTGTITSDNATLRVRYGNQTGIFVNQLQYTQMAAGGDSGSLIWDLNTLTVVGLHFAGSVNGPNCFGNKILRVLELLSRALTIYDLTGKPIHFEKTDISLLESAKARPRQKTSTVRGKHRKKSP